MPYSEKDDMPRKFTFLKILFAAALSAGALSAGAQDDYVIHLQPDKKVINARNLDLPGSTEIKDLLLMLPDLLNRDGDKIFDNYDVRINGKSVGENRDIILMRTMLHDIDRIEIISSPTVTQQKNGESGIINIVPISLEDGPDCNVYVIGSTEYDLATNVVFNYKKGRMELRSNVGLEMYRPMKAFDITEIENDSFAVRTDTTFNRYLQETASVGLNFKLTDKDILDLWFLESVSSDREEARSWDEIFQDRSDVGEGWLYREHSNTTSASTDSQLAVNMQMKYAHKFIKEREAGVQIGFDYGNRRTFSESRLASLSKPFTMTSTVSYNHPVNLGDKRKLTINVGNNANLIFNDSDVLKGRNLYVSPFTSLDLQLKDWRIQAGAGYQYYRRKYSYSGTAEQLSQEHNFVANVNVFWQLLPHHALRLTANRNIMRPTEEQLCPEWSFVKKDNMPQVGNSGLRSGILNSLMLNYIHDWHKSGYNLVYTLEFGYDCASDLIRSVNISPEGLDGGYYRTFVNSGRNDIFKARGSVLFSHGIFTLSLTGSMFINSMGAEGHYSCYNINLTPVFRFTNEWTLSGQVLYNSPVNSGEDILGDCFLVDMRLTKNMGKWTFFAELSDVLDYKSYDIRKSNGKTIYTLYDMVSRFLSLGVSLHL